MDRLWAILPNIYAWLFLYTAIYFNPINDKEQEYSILKSDNSSFSRLVLMAILIFIWGVRLVYVFWRRGYYSMSHEDHRWEFIRKRLNYPERKLPFHLYNFILMAFIQNWILLGHAMPFWFILTNTSQGRIKMQQPFNICDLIVASLFVFFLLFEIIGDEQQWIFQSAKHKWYLQI
jgi:steroid 5-alpha reductase family enzyme